MVQALLWRRWRQHRRGGHGWTGERKRVEECVRGRVQSSHLPLSTTRHGTRPRIPACLLPPQRRHRRIQFPPASIYARRRRRISCPRPQSRRKPLPAATTHAPAHPGTYAQVPCTCPLHALTGPADRSGSPSPCPAGHRAAAAIHPPSGALWKPAAGQVPCRPSSPPELLQPLQPPQPTRSSKPR